MKTKENPTHTKSYRRSTKSQQNSGLMSKFLKLWKLSNWSRV